MDQSQPTPTTETAEQQPKDDSQKYVYVGLAIGALISLLTIGSFFLKSKPINTKLISTPMRTITVGQQMPTTPLVVPVPITTRQELISQQSALDDLDMDSILKDLEENSSASSEFAL